MHIVSKDTTLYFRATDINPEALECTRRCSEINLGNSSQAIQTVQTSLTGALEERLERSIDLLIFNPPYVPTVDEEVTLFTISNSTFFTDF